MKELPEEPWDLLTQPLRPPPGAPLHRFPSHHPQRGGLVNSGTDGGTEIALLPLSLGSGDELASDC